LEEGCKHSFTLKNIHQAMSNEESYLGISLRKVAKGAGIAFAGTFIGLALAYFSRMVIARWLGASDYGLICLGFAAMTIGTGLSLVGLPTAVQRYVSFYKGREDAARIKGAIIGALEISFPLSVIFALLLFFGADWLSIHIFHEPNLTHVLRIFSLGIPFSALVNNFVSATVGFQDLRYRVYVNELFQNIFKLIVIVVLLTSGFEVIGAAWGWVLAVIGMPFLAFYFLQKKVFPIFNTKTKAIPMKGELLSFSWPLIFTTFAGLIMGYMDTLMLGYFSTAYSVGIYNAVLPTAGVLRTGGGAFGLIFMPVASELYARNKEQNLKDIYTTVTKWILCITLPAFLLMALFSDWIMKILFGPEFVVSAQALSILAFSFFISSLFGLSGSLLQAYGRTKIIMVCSFAAAGANFILNLLLIPIYGVKGAAIATGISVLIGGLLRFLFALRIVKMQPFRKNYHKFVIASLLAVFIVYAVTKYVVGISIPSLIGMLFIFLALYFLLLLLFKSFEQEDLMIMRAIDQRLGIKSRWIRRIVQRFL